MTEALKAPCELGLCNALHQERLDDDTNLYIAENCRNEIAQRLEHDSSYDITQCPVAGLAAAVIMRTEGEAELQQLERG